MQTFWWDAVSPDSAVRGLGQRIVDVLASSVQQNINLMNAQGIIVASTDSSRIGAEHRAALEVLESGRPVIVTKPVDGVPDRPGINLPVTVDGQISGVLGITGDPETVEPVARVVALAVELLIEQERELQTANATRARAREIVAALTSSGQSLVKVHELLALAGLGEGPWTLGVWAAQSPRQDGSAQPPGRAEQTVMAVNDARMKGLPGPAVSVVRQGVLWVIARERPGDAAAGSSVSSRRRQGSLDSELAGPGTRHHIVPRIDSLGELRAWAQDLAALARWARLLPVSDRMPDPDPAPPIELALAVAHLPEATTLRMASTAARLSPSLRETVRVLAAAGSMAEGARALFLHRNTLLQRVSRIRVLTDLDLRKPEESAVLRLALLAHEATQLAS